MDFIGMRDELEKLGTFVCPVEPTVAVVLSGAKYAFSAVRGRLTRGVPTACAAAPLNTVIAPTADPVPVWPHKNGTVRGASLSC